jgi:hypothetical protein
MEHKIYSHSLAGLKSVMRKGEKKGKIWIIELRKRKIGKIIGIFR